MLHSVGLSDPTAAATVVYPHFTPFPPTNSSSLNSNENSNHFTNNTTNNNSNTNTNGMYTSNTAAAAAAAVAALTAAAAASAGLPSNIKDSRWLTLEVCRQYQRNQCSRDENECKFAHPPTHVDVQSGRVICCYDSIKSSLQMMSSSLLCKGKCQRRDPPCKYLHPPQHLREQLIQNGRNNMIMRNLLYTTPAALALSNQTAAPSAYPLLNIGFSPYLNALTATGMTSLHGVPNLPAHITTTTPRHLLNTNNTAINGLSTKRSTAAAAAANGVIGPHNTLSSHFPIALPDHTGYFQAPYHIEIPSFSYQ
ncbi:Muscleblind-like protein [Schistosoma japonicum]|nr:Muscleblind-like protein [Schistosoma japonicum]